MENDLLQGYNSNEIKKRTSIKRTKLSKCLLATIHFFTATEIQWITSSRIFIDECHFTIGHFIWLEFNPFDLLSQSQVELYFIPTCE